MAASINISLSETLLAQVQGTAAAEHKSLDEVVADAVTHYLEDRSWTTLLGYGQQRAKELGTTEDDIDRAIAATRAEQRGR